MLLTGRCGLPPSFCTVRMIKHTFLISITCCLFCNAFWSKFKTLLKRKYMELHSALWIMLFMVHGMNSWTVSHDRGVRDRECHGGGRITDLCYCTTVVLTCSSGTVKAAKVAQQYIGINYMFVSNTVLRRLIVLSKMLTEISTISWNSINSKVQKICWQLALELINALTNLRGYSDYLRANDWNLLSPMKWVDYPRIAHPGFVPPVWKVLSSFQPKFPNLSEAWNTDCHYQVVSLLVLFVPRNEKSQ